MLERGAIMSGKTAKKKKKIKIDELTPEEKMNYEIAAEMGLLDKVMTEGWQALSAKETGKIGGMVSRRRKAEKSH